MIGREDRRDDRDLQRVAERLQRGLRCGRASVYQCVEKPPQSVPLFGLVEAEHDEHDDRREQEREHDAPRGTSGSAAGARSSAAHSASSPTRDRYANTPSRMKSISSTDIAEPSGQLLPLPNWSYTVLPNIWVFTPPSSSGVTKSPTAGMNTRSTPAMRPGRDGGQDHPPERRRLAVAEVVARLHERLVHALDRRVQRQDHERQEAVGEAEDHREVRVEELVVVAEAERSEQRVQQPVALQDHQPAVGADQVAREERDDHEHEVHVAEPSAEAGDPIREREAEQHARDRRRPARTRSIG